MKDFKNIKSFFIAIVTMVILTACHHTEKPKPTPIFTVLDDAKTGLHFTNKLTPTPQFNMFNYMYFYNGAGVGAGDFNNDGLIDLFFAANQTQNKLFLNKGKLHFEEVTELTGIPNDSSWSTGVSVVDINNDGLLDIYVCKVGNFETLKGRNELFICTGINKEGIPHYIELAKEYGLGFSGFSTQALFFDYDMDGDLDMFLLNHSVHQNGTFAPRSQFLGTYNPVSGDRLYRNDGPFTLDEGGPRGGFTDVTKESKINSSAISYGLGVAASDINLDGWPDLYVGNDFHENDYLYINQKNGTFAEDNNNCLMHTSQFSMGVDVADVTNDGYPEIISMDMLPGDPYMLKRSLGEDDYDIFFHKISVGYNYQYTRNNLQYNRRNNMFSETGLFSGVAATDWSWAPLWMDFDNDGNKDLFISNGIPKRMNDMDYVNFISNDEIQAQLRNKSVDDKNMGLINKFPEIKLPNKFYHNTGGLHFDDEAEAIEGDKATFSNGAVYADLDGDGDLDIIVNNVDDPVLLYENKSNDKKDKPFTEIKLKGSNKNINAVGAKVVLFANGGIRTYENNPARGFLSSMMVPLHIGLANTKVDSAFLIWPDNTFQPLTLKANQSIALTYQSGLPKFIYTSITSFSPYHTKTLQNITASTSLNYKHQEDAFVEFDRERLIPHMLSTEGPALAVADINGDGLEDVFLGSSKGYHNAIFLQGSNGKFMQTAQPEMALDSMCEDVDAIWTDVNGDKFPDLVIASGGNEYYGTDNILLPRVYLNDGQAHFKKLQGAFTNLYETFSSVAPCDFNGDGKMDLFMGGRSVPWEYGVIPKSYLLQNDGAGKFTDITDKYAKDLGNIGMVTSGVWCDVNKDGQKDLVVSCEWGGITAFMNNKGNFTKTILTDKTGWWNNVFPIDIDGDGDLDFIAGNLGQNSRLKASAEQPVRMYFNDFDDNGKKEQVLTYYVNGRELPFANKDELQKQMPAIKKKFLYADDFAKASIEDIFSKEKLENSEIFTANYFSNAVLINDGKGNFTTTTLPWEAQLSCYRDAIQVDANGDNLPDVLLVGNYYDNNIQMGRYDADFGTLLINKGKGRFAVESLNGLQVKGEVRHIRSLMVGKQQAYVLAKNNDSTMVIEFKQLLKK